MHQNQNDHQPWLFLRSQLMSEGMVEDYWERVKSRHIRNYNNSNSTNNTNTTSNTNTTTTTNLTSNTNSSSKLSSKSSQRRPAHPMLSPLRMPHRGWTQYQNGDVLKYRATKMGTQNHDTTLMRQQFHLWHWDRALTFGVLHSIVIIILDETTPCINWNRIKSI